VRSLPKPEVYPQVAAVITSTTSLSMRFPNSAFYPAFVLCKEKDGRGER